MAKTAAELRAKAQEILDEAKTKSAQLIKRAEEIEAAEDLKLVKALRAAGKLEQLKAEMGVVGTEA